MDNRRNPWGLTPEIQERRRVKLEKALGKLVGQERAAAQSAEWQGRKLDLAFPSFVEPVTVRVPVLSC